MKTTVNKGVDMRLQGAGPAHPDSYRCNREIWRLSWFCMVAYIIALMWCSVVFYLPLSSCASSWFDPIYIHPPSIHYILYLILLYLSYSYYILLFYLLSTCSPLPPSCPQYLGYYGYIPTLYLWVSMDYPLSLVVP